MKILVRFIYRTHWYWLLLHLVLVFNPFYPLFIIMTLQSVRYIIKLNILHRFLLFPLFTLWYFSIVIDSMRNRGCYLSWCHLFLLFVLFSLSIKVVILISWMIFNYRVPFGSNKSFSIINNELKLMANHYSDFVCSKTLEELIKDAGNLLRPLVASKITKNLNLFGSVESFRCF